MKSISREYDQKHIDALMTLSQDIVSEKYLEGILQLVVTVAGNVSDIDSCFLWLIDESKRPKKVRLKASHGADLGNMGKHAFALNEGMADFVTGQQEPVVVNDVLALTRFEEKANTERCGLHSMLGLPLRAPDGDPIGALICFTAKPHDFSGKEIEQMSAMADKAAITIVNTALMVKTRVALEELETLKLVERAGKVLMRRQGIGEDEAWNRIRHYSTGSLKSPRRIAETILLSDAIEIDAEEKPMVFRH